MSSSIRQAPNYDELASIISSHGDGMSAAECHGLLCGMLCCQQGLDGDDWVTRLLNGELDASGGEAVTVSEQDKDALRALFDHARKQLDDNELGFHLLLPEDDTTLQVRTDAIANWCEGYLFGLSLGGIKDFKGFPEQVMEFANDLVEIARLDHEDDDSEENENAFFEVVEYVRMGVLMMCDELATVGQHAAAKGDDNIVLH